MVDTVSITDLQNAKLDTDHIADIATSLSATATDRLGTTKKTLQGAIASIAAIDVKGAWATTTGYVVKDAVLESGTWYICLITHTSGTFATDLAAGKWSILQGITDANLLNYAARKLDYVADMKAMTNPQAGEIIMLKDYANGNGAGVMFFETKSGTGTDDGGSVINHDTLAFRFEQIFGNTISVKQFGAVGDGITLDTNRLLSAKNFGGNIVGKNGDIYLVDNEILLDVDNTTFDLLGAEIKAAPALPSTANVVKITSTNTKIKNGKVNGNRANLLNPFTTGIYGNGVLVADGASNVVVDSIETFECPTNGQLAVSQAGSISHVRFINYNSHDNAWTGIGGEAQVNGTPLNHIQFIGGETYGNELGGDIRIQGITNFLVSGHIGTGSDHGAAVIGVGEAKNVTTGKIVDSFLANNNIGLPTLSVDGMVGGAGPYAGQLEVIEVELDNVTLEGNGGNNGLLTKNGAIVTGGIVTASGHSISLTTQSGSLVEIDQFISKDSSAQALDIDSIVDLPNVRLEMWGATSAACVFRANSSTSTVRGDFGASSGETGKDGVAQVGSPSNIKLDINSFTGSGLSKGLISGSIANTWEINEKGSRNILEIEDGILAPSAEVGRAKLYVDVGDGNLKLLKGDGAITTFDPIVATTAQLEDISSAINTDGRKTKGLYVHNDTTNKAVFANTNLASDVWLDATGAIVHTPI